MSFRALCITDLHILDAASMREAVAGCEQAIAAQRPDLVVCLGDIFDGRPHLDAMGRELHAALRALHPNWIFVFGNHDGSSTTKGQNDEGTSAFSGIFGPVQRVHEIAGRRFVVLANAQEDSGWETFAEREINEGAVVLSHIPIAVELRERWSSRGVRLLLAGHKHVLRKARSANGRLTQWILPPFLFGGMSGDPAGYGILEFSGDQDDSHSLRWVARSLPPMPGNSRVAPGPAMIPPYRRILESAAQDALAPWCECRAAEQGDFRWFGGPARAACYRGRELLWDKSFGRSMLDACAPQIVEHAGVQYLILGGTWVKPGPDKQHGSVVIVDPLTGAERFRVGVIGVTAQPVVVDGVLYIAGQWRELIAVDLASGRELWRRRCQFERTDPPDLSWFDAHVGGGWTTCQPAVGRHVWSVNARGDLFGYDRATGAERFVHPAAIPVNAVPACPYGNRQACAIERFERRTGPGGVTLFEANGQAVNDDTGELASGGPVG